MQQERVEANPNFPFPDVFRNVLMVKHINCRFRHCMRRGSSFSSYGGQQGVTCTSI